MHSMKYVNSGYITTGKITYTRLAARNGPNGFTEKCAAQVSDQCVRDECVKEAEFWSERDVLRDHMQ